MPTQPGQSTRPPTPPPTPATPPPEPGALPDPAEAENPARAKRARTGPAEGRPVTRSIPTDSPRNRYHAHRFRARIRLKRHFARQFQEAGDIARAHALRDCSETEALMCCSSCGRSWYVMARCRQRACPICAALESYDRQAWVLRACRKTTRPKLLTLTMPPLDDDPRDAVRRLRAAFARLRRTKLFSRVRAGAYVFELKPTPHRWHVHLHAILDAPFMPYRQLFSAWRAILRVKHVEIDIRTADNQQAQRYIAKYAAKSAHYEGQEIDIVTWTRAVRGVRTWGTFGRWHHSSPDYETLDDPTPKAPSKCPHCQAEGACFPFACGSFVFGNDNWQHLSRVYAGPDPPSRPAPDLIAYARQHPNDALVDHQVRYAMNQPTWYPTEVRHDSTRPS